MMPGNILHILLKKTSKLPQCLAATRGIYSGVGVIGFPFSGGQNKTGVERGPEVIRSTGLINNLREMGYNVQDYKDLVLGSAVVGKTETEIKNGYSVGEYCQQVSEAVARIVRSGQLCLSLGGDHSIGLGTVAGSAEAFAENGTTNLGVIWVDAHADINTSRTSPSGHAHGMPVSYLLRELRQFHQDHPAFRWVTPRLSAQDVVYIGLRDVDPLERLIMKKFGLRAYDMRDVDRYGIKDVVAMAMDAINPTGRRPIHVSFDIDSLDPSIAPSTGTPVSGGLTMREGLYVAEEVARTGSLCSLDIVEVNPEIGSESDVSKTLWAAKQIILSYVGSERRGNLPRNVDEIPRPDVTLKIEALGN